ncbi:MAG TPA: lipoyl synthase [Actinobacteria bacterium]|nr:lipoyl synthase [Actinomycetota bacterium]
MELTDEFERNSLSTVCEETACPNIWECFFRREAAFLIMGTICTRACGHCRIKSGKPTVPQEGESRRIAESVASLGLESIVIASVARDDLHGGGAKYFVDTIKEIRARVPKCQIEVLIPDFGGDLNAVTEVVDARPDIIGHNIEVVSRLFPALRPQADYERSLAVLKKLVGDDMAVKSNIMVGLGETRSEIRAAGRDLVGLGLKTIMIGQYLQPSREHHAVRRYYRPAEFMGLAKYFQRLGFRRVVSGPIVRSSLRGVFHDLTPPKTLSGHTT